MALTDLTSGMGSHQPGTGALADECALEFGQGTKNAHKAPRSFLDELLRHSVAVEVLLQCAVYVVGLSVGE